VTKDERGGVRAALWRAAVSLVVILAVVFAVLAPPERCPSVTAGELRRAAASTVGWFVRNQEPNGSWLYEYDADRDSTASEYNEVRHAGVTMGLYQAAAAGLPGALRSADRGIEWALDRLYERDGTAALAAPDGVNTGATALLAAGLVIRREATGETRYDNVLRRLGRFLVAQTEPSGATRLSRAGTRATTPGRPTGPSRSFTEFSPARVGTRPRTGSAPTSPRRATRSRTIGRRSPIIGRPTACPRPRRSPSAAAPRSAKMRRPTPAGRPSSSACRPAG
jgi:hypothetical protein